MSSMTGRGPMVGSSGRTGNIIPKGYKQGQLQQMTPEQMRMLQQMGERLGPDSWLSRLAMGDESMFGEMEAPAMKQFSALQGNLASRFSGMGQGARKSSGFQNTANQAAQDFAGQLQGKRMELRNQAMQDLMGYTNQFLGQRPYENFLVEKQQKQNPWAEIAGKFAGAVPGAVAGFLTGGPAGAAIGAGSSFLSSGGGGSPRPGNNVSGPYNLPTFGGY